MWNFADSLPAGSLNSWYRWLTLLTIGLPILGGVCGYAAFMVSSRLSGLQAVALKQAHDTAAEAKQVAMPRHLRDDHKRQFMATLSSNAGYSVVIVSAMLDHEAGDFVDDFVEPFRDCKWTVAPRVIN